MSRPKTLLMLQPRPVVRLRADSRLLPPIERFLAKVDGRAHQ